MVIGILNTALFNTLGAHIDKSTKGKKTRSEKTAPKNNIGSIVPLPRDRPPNILQNFNKVVERKVSNNYTNPPITKWPITHDRGNPLYKRKRLRGHLMLIRKSVPLGVEAFVP